MKLLFIAELARDLPLSKQNIQYSNSEIDSYVFSQQNLYFGLSTISSDSFFKSWRSKQRYSGGGI